MSIDLMSCIEVFVLTVAILAQVCVRATWPAIFAGSFGTFVFVTEFWND